MALVHMLMSLHIIKNSFNLERNCCVADSYISKAIYDLAIYWKIFRAIKRAM